MHSLGREIRTTVVVVVLAVLSAIALWPRDDSPSPRAADSAKTRGTPSSRESVLDNDAALEPLRRRAALRPCPRTDPGDRAVGPLAGVTVPCLGESRSVDLGAALAGRPALLNIWASWCAVCRTEVPALAEYAMREGSIPVVGVNVKDRASSALKLMLETRAHYPSVVDVDREIRRALNAPPVVPLTYLLYPDGSVRRVTDPMVFESADEVADAVRRLLPEHR